MGSEKLRLILTVITNGVIQDKELSHLNPKFYLSNLLALVDAGLNFEYH